MGGSRFSDVAATVRIGRTQHDEMAALAVERLAGLGVQARGIPTLRSKDDFGDVDLITTRSRIDAAGDEEVARALGAIAHHRGDVKDPTFSLLMPGVSGNVQMDVICVDDDLLDFATAQLSYGEACPLSGIVARQFGMKLGMQGLLLLEDDERGLMRSRIEVGHAEALDMVGLDHAAHARGFDRLEDVFAWIAAGRYFDPGIFDLDRMTNRARARATRRPAYSAFLSWMARTRPEGRYDWGPRGSRTAEWRDRIAAAHPDAADRFDAIRRTRGERGTLREFFSGEAVARATGVSGARLGHLMNAIRGDLGIETLRRMADAGSTADLEREARRMAATEYLPEDFVEEAK